VVRFSNTAGRLLPGMTANVRVVTDSRESVLKIPNAALRVRIAGVEPAASPAAGPASASGARPGSGNGTAGTTVGWSWLPQAQAQPAGGGGGGALAAMRERLVTELKLSAEQQAGLDAISAEVRPQFMALRELPEDQRGPAREKALAEMRAKITAMLTPEQKAQYAQMQGQAATGLRQAQPERSVAQAERGGAGAGAGNPIAEFRARLLTELQLTPSQVEKVDAIYADVRPKFMQLRDLPAEERTKARERISAEVRARIGDLLTPEQKPKYAAMLAEAAGRASLRGRIYLLAEDGKPKAFNVRLGITDGTSTELMVAPSSPDAGELKEGAAVITGVTARVAPAPAARSAGPRMPF